MKNIRRNSPLFVPLLLMALALSATAQTSAKKKSSAPDSTVTITEAQNGGDVDLTPGQTLQVKLKVVSGTGYAWAVSGDPGPPKLMKTSTQRSKAAKPGAGQLAVFDFSAGSAGMSTLTMVYRRSWEYNVPPAKTFTVRVNVR